MRARVVLAVCVGATPVGLGCGGGARSAAAPARETSVTADPELVEITYLEAERSFGRPRIADLTTHGSPSVRARAVRALGRVGDDESLDILDQLMEDGDASVRIEVIRALGVAGATRRAPLLGRSYRSSDAADLRVAALEALGRVGTAAQLGLLTDALRDGPPGEKEAAAVAMGLFGRRQLPLDKSARDALYAAAGAKATAVRHAVAYALAREHQPDEDSAAESALKALARDVDGEVRTTAIEGMAARSIRSTEVFVAALDDDDWRVRMAGVRALAGTSSSVANREFLAAWLAREWALLTTIQGLAGARVHVVTEGLTALRDHARETAVQASAVGLFDASAKFLETESLPEKRLGAGHVNCMAAALRVRGGAPLRFLWDCGGGRDSEVPIHVRRVLAAEALGAGFGGEVGERVEKLRELAGAEDSQIRAAAATAAGVMFARNEPGAREPAEALLRAALADAKVDVVGAAAEAIGALAKSEDKAIGSASRELLAQLIARAQQVAPAELDLRLTMIDALTGVTEAMAVCQAAHSDPNSAVREAARACLRANAGRDLGQGTSARAPERPPVNPAGILGKQVVWTVETSRGTVEIELDPDVAPWHVAVLLSLTDEKLYDGLVWHRVVPGFVSQTGDPTGTGWGGPGFVVPREPSARKFVRGAVGIAEAGKDTGGSQWFVTHARTPHLDGRYTFVGMVTKGQDVLESLVVGDRVLRASMTVMRRPAPAATP